MGTSILQRLSESSVFYSLKLYLAAALALWAAFRFNLEYPYWTMMCVYIFALPLTGCLRAKCIQAVVGTLIGGPLGVAVVGLFQSQQMQLVALTALLATGLILAFRHRHSWFYLYLLAGFTCLIVALPGLTTPDAAFMRVFVRLESVLVAACSLVLVDSLLLPRLAVVSGRAQTLAWLDALRALTIAVLQGRGLDRQKSADLVRQAIPLTTLHDGLAHDGDGRQSRRESQVLAGAMADGLKTLPLLSSLDDLAEPSSALGATLRHELAQWLEQGAEAGASVDLRRVLQPGPSAGLGWEQQAELRALRGVYWLWRQRLAKPYQVAHPSGARPVPHTVAQVEWGNIWRTAMAVALYMLMMSTLWAVTGWGPTTAFGMLLGAIFCSLGGMMDAPTMILRKAAVIGCTALLIVGCYSVLIFPHITEFSMLLVVLFPALFFWGLKNLEPGGVIFAVLPMAMLRLGDSPATADVASLLNSALAMLLAFGVAALANAIARQPLWSEALTILRRRDRQALTGLASARSRRGRKALRQCFDRVLLAHVHATDEGGWLSSRQALYRYRLLTLMQRLRQWETTGAGARADALRPLWERLPRSLKGPVFAPAELHSEVTALLQHASLGRSPMLALAELQRLLECWPQAQEGRAQ